MVMEDVIHSKEIITNSLTVKTGMDLTSAQLVLTSATLTRPSQVYHFNASSGKVGATAGFVTTNNTGMATLPQSQTASTWTIPLNFKQGDIINSYLVSGQIDSAGNTVTVDADLRVLTAATAGSTDASIGAITQISKTADYKIADSKTGLTHTVISGNQYYMLVTATTGATCDIELLTVEVSVTEK